MFWTLKNLYFEFVSDLELRISDLRKIRPANFESFMQNKPNFRKAKMNVNLALTKDYRKNYSLASKKTNPNKPNSNPKQTQSPKCPK